MDGDGLKGPAPINEYKSTDHVMRRVVIDKVVINIGVGTAGEELQKAETVIGLITGGRKPIRTMSKTTNKDFDVRKNAPIGCKVTLRGKAAEKFLQAAFWVRDSKITGYSFDKVGNFSFGINDYTDFPGMRYDPGIGVHGMDICVTMKRPGRRVSERRIRAAPIGKGHRLTPAETKDYLKQRFQVEVLE